MTDDIPEDVMAVALKISLNDYRYGRVYDGEMPPNTYAVQRAVDIARAILAERLKEREACAKAMCGLCRQGVLFKGPWHFLEGTDDPERGCHAQAIRSRK